MSDTLHSVKVMLAELHGLILVRLVTSGVSRHQPVGQNSLQHGWAQTEG
jgi:hypothetical protein